MTPELTDALAILVGAIGTAILIVVRFYFGSGTKDDCQPHDSHHEDDSSASDENVSPKE
jgi:hypothetical protein